jgi:hypothetical protein
MCLVGTPTVFGNSDGVPVATCAQMRSHTLTLAHGQSPGWQAILPFLGRLPAIVLSSAVGLVEINPPKPNAVPGSA